MKTLNPYLSFNCNAGEAFNAHKSVPGGEFPAIIRFNGARDSDGHPSADGGKILHTTLSTGNSSILMAIGAPESMSRSLRMENNFHCPVDAESEQEANKLCDTRSAGGKVGVSLQKISKHILGIDVQTAYRSVRHSMHGK